MYSGVCRAWLMISLALGVLVIACASLLLGQYPIVPSDVIAFIFSRGKAAHDPVLHNVLLSVRLPRVLGALLVIDRPNGASDVHP